MSIVQQLLEDKTIYHSEAQEKKITCALMSFYLFPHLQLTEHPGV